MTVNIYDMAQTWNNGATTFTGIKLNVTDTASAATSKLLDLQVGGSSKLRVLKTGFVDCAGLTFSGGTSRMLDTAPNGGLFLRTAGQAIRLAGLHTIGWNSHPSDSTSGSADVILARDAANTLALRNGVNAQAFNIYNTYTDASNYERGFMKWNSNVLEIGTEAAGTGSLRSLSFNGSDILLNTNGTRRGYVDGDSLNLDAARLMLTSSTLGYMQMVEQPSAPPAPSANNVRIYAEDDGAGKTRLMARFATGVAQQIAIEP